MLDGHPSRSYAQQAVKKRVNAPRYVVKQCRVFLTAADGRDKKYTVNEDRVQTIDALLNLMIMPKGLKQGRPIAECLAGFQWLFIVAALCVVYRDNPDRRRYTTAILEICRKNGKTFLVAVLFILLLFLEPKFSNPRSWPP